MTGTMLKIRRLEGFDDTTFSQHQWDALLQSSHTNSVFLTHAYQRTWWSSFGRGELLLLVAERDGQARTVAPLFCDAGMVFIVGSGGSDYLDFIGQVDAETIGALLTAARDYAPDFVGFRFYHVPEGSPTAQAVQAAAVEQDWDCFEEGELPAPRLVFRDSESMHSAARKTSLVRHDNRLQRQGDVAFHHGSDVAEILPHLDEFFDQHVERWDKTPYPSLFLDPVQRCFYRELVVAGAQSGWLRFSRLQLSGRSVAFHFGFCFAGEFLWYKPSFDIRLEHLSPGTVLLARLFQAALTEKTSVFDFGIGDEPFKHRHANQVRRILTWGLYPKAVQP